MSDEGKLRICIKSNNYEYRTCPRSFPHEIITTEDPCRLQCLKGAFCYYKNIPVHCKEVQTSDERKERLLKHINHVFNECREYIESKNNDCLNCLEGADTCYQVYEEMKRLIQHQPKIDEDETLGNPELMASIEKAGKQIKEGFIIQQQPEIDEKYVEEKARELSRMSLWEPSARKELVGINPRKAYLFITQIISDVKGRKK